MIEKIELDVEKIDHTDYGSGAIGTHTTEHPEYVAGCVGCFERKARDSFRQPPIVNLRVYMAGPCFSNQDQELLLYIAGELGKISGTSVFVPHRDAGSWVVRGRAEVFDMDIRAIQTCNVVVAVLDGADIDSGTAAELGYAYAIGKYTIGYCSDLRRRGKSINAFISGLLKAPLLSHVDQVVVTVREFGASAYFMPRST